ncbi:unnamed protein product [Didymodactylos carnosus]|uniref:Short-chain dehydrogenase/reductase 3 n=1 Tax=Didymodactylos carnosus TaxID=1234261 RepID=A0A814BL83_9BILA|nr:unnamed protein product [Didymodactylos carnosus]CAF0966622.1 unnamed protein product [Didymodactylos carnosus]CAF3708817.1 unnamed protein product [Didymodactylos carnosus]CAF3738419.1 unnamed protein product [Didymodactylos carnosus]
MVVSVLRFMMNLFLYPFALAFLLFYRILQWSGLKAMNYDFHNEIVLITGSARGVGRQIALAFARSGASLALWDIDDIGNRETLQMCLSLGIHVRCYHVDITKYNDVHLHAERVRKELGNVTILVNNAGHFSGKTFLQESETDIEQTFSCNSLSCIWLTKLFLPYMLDINYGHIVIVSSILGLEPTHGPITYAASKFGSVGFSQSLIYELKSINSDTKVNVHCICPYFITTTMFNGFKPKLQFLIPALDASYVAIQTLDSIAWNRQLVILPYRLKYITFLSHVLPKWLKKQLMFYVAGQKPLDMFVNKQKRDYMS